MRLLDISLTEEPVDMHQFKYSCNDEYPKIIIGTAIHHKYDQQRIQISQKYKPENIFHIQPSPIIQTNFFKGIPFKVANKYTELIEDIDYASGISFDFKLEEYTNILKKYNLSCSECHLFFSKGVYPINGNCIDTLTNGKIKIVDLYNNFFANAKGCFQCTGGLSIFILTSNYLADEIYENLFQSEDTILNSAV